MTGRLARSWIVLALLAQASCAIVPPPVPDSFVIEYQTGSIPPPFNYTYTLTGTFVGEQRDAIEVRYDLTYRFREGMTQEELAAEGYGPDDDIHWQGTLEGAEVGTLSGLAINARLGPGPEQQPGADSFVVSVQYADSRWVEGVPAERAEWERSIAQIDQRARVETGIPRSEP